MMMVNSAMLLSDPIRDWHDFCDDPVNYPENYSYKIPEDLLYYHDEFMDGIYGISWDCGESMHTIQSFPYDFLGLGDWWEILIRTPFLDRGSTAPWFNNGYTSADLTADGLKGSNDAFLDTEANLVTLNGDSGPTTGIAPHGICVTESTEEADIDYGVTGGGSPGSNQQMRTDYTGAPNNRIICNMYGDGTPATWPSNPDTTGMVYVVAVAPPADIWYARHVSSSSAVQTVLSGSANAFSPPTNNDFSVGTYNGQVLYRTSKRYSFFFESHVANATDVDGLYDLINILRENIGGGTM
jgi:hypothetical protein